MCEVLDAFHFDVSLSQYIETQTGKRITDGEEKDESDDIKPKTVAASERPSEEPISHAPVAYVPAANNMEISDDIDEGIEVGVITPIYFTHFNMGVKSRAEFLQETFRGNFVKGFY